MESNSHLYLVYLPVQWTGVVVLLLLGGCFAGLTLGLMSLDPTSLKILSRVGQPKEREYARKIYPLRKNGNLLLCTLLLGNVVVNNALTILLEQLTDGVIAIVASTAGIVIFGEIIPQSLFSRYGLVTGARTVWLTRTFMVLLFPIAFPFSKVLDWILGEELGAHYNRDELRELLQNTTRHTNLERDEVAALQGALELRRTTVGEVMTLLPHLFMIEADCVLDASMIEHLHKRHFSRIPVYARRKGVVIGVLHTRDLSLAALQLTRGNTPLTARSLMSTSLIVSFRHVTLDVLLREFRSGRAHVCIVRNLPGDSSFTDPAGEELGLRVRSAEEADDLSNAENAVGMVTLTDVIEIMIGGKIASDTSYLHAMKHGDRKPSDSIDEDSPLINAPEEGARAGAAAVGTRYV